MKLSEYPKPYRDCWASHEACLRLGFSADDLYFGFGPVSDNLDVVHLQLKVEEKTFTMATARLPGADRDHVIKTWQGFAVEVRSADLAELERCWLDSPFGQSAMVLLELAARIHDKGIRIPVSEIQVAAESLGEVKRTVSPG